MDKEGEQVKGQKMGLALVMACLLTLLGWNAYQTKTIAASGDEKIGAEVCLKKIKDKIWFLLGFLLQTANCDLTDYIAGQIKKNGLEYLDELFNDLEKEIFKMYKRD